MLFIIKLFALCYNTHSIEIKEEVDQVNTYLNTIAKLKQDEGFRSKPYLDTEGVWTIGYGSTYLWNGSDFIQVNKDTQPINKIDAEMQLSLSLLKAVKRASTFVNNYSELSPVRQSVLAMMAYQLGGTGLNGFVETRKYIEKNMFMEASAEMLDSMWARQTYRRAERAADMFATGEWA